MYFTKNLFSYSHKTLVFQTEALTSSSLKQLIVSGPKTTALRAQVISGFSNNIFQLCYEYILEILITKGGRRIKTVFILLAYFLQVNLLVVVTEAYTLVIVLG